MKEEQEKRFISLLSDTTFKHFFKIEDYKDFFNIIIKFIINMDINDFKLYDNEMMQKKMINTAHNWGYDDGKADGLEEGKRQEQIAIAKNLLEKGISPKIVSESTGLSIEELENLTD